MSINTDMNYLLPEPTSSTLSLSNNQLRRIWRYTITIAVCLLLLALFAIASLIILSLIPLYLPKKEVDTIDHNESSATFNIIYNSNLTVGNALTLTDFQTLSNDMSNALHIKRLTINNATFLSQTSTNSRKKRQSIDINNLQCSSTNNMIGDWFVVSITIENVQGCFTTACNKVFFANAQKNIQTVYKTINMNMKFIDAQMRHVQLTFCSLGQSIVNSSRVEFSTQQFLTQCQTILSNNNSHNITNNGQRKLKMYPAARILGNRVLLEHTYLIEFSSNANGKNHLQTITQSLNSTVQQRYIIESLLFSGISIYVNDKNAIEVLEAIDEIVAIYPVYTVSRSQISKTYISSKIIENTTQTDLINSYDLTGVNQVHEELGNYGHGVRVAIIDSGVYYLHPALGGCFGQGCKVAFGYDFVGDNSTNIADNDPLENCTLESSGTHVAGIIAGNSTGITETTYMPNMPFIGVAPQVTLGAYRVYGCSNTAPSDAIVAAIYRAQHDNADIITLAIDGVDPYAESPEAIAIQRVIDAGVYVTIAAGNDGIAGLQTSTAASALTTASVNNKYIVASIIIAPDGSEIFYSPGINSGGWQSRINSTIVVNNPNKPVNDGCSGPLKSVDGTIVLYYYNSNDTCSSMDRCNAAANAGAIGCLIYNADSITGASTIPSGSINIQDGLNIIETVNSNTSAVYTFTDTVRLVESKTGGTPSSFTAFGLSADLLFEPQISSIGANVYSTISLYANEKQHSTRAYAIYSDASLASAYLAGTLALFLASIGNPPANATNSNCRPPFSLVKSIFQCTSIPLNIYNLSLFASTAQQGAGLVNVHQALTINTLFSPSELALNDTLRTEPVYTVNLRNIGNTTGIYKLHHIGAALVTGKTASNDQLLNTPIQSDDYANVDINPNEFELEPGESRNVTLRFTAPISANSTLLPIYSGFIYATNSIDRKSIHLSYAGIVGNYEDAYVLVQNEESPIITSIYNATGYYVFDVEYPILNLTEGVYITPVLAWSTRILFVEVISTDNTSYGLIYSVTDNEVFYLTNIKRNVMTYRAQTLTQYYEKFWNGHVCRRDSTVNCTRLLDGKYTIQFAVLKHFGNATDIDDFELYHTPPFNLIY